MRVADVAFRRRVRRASVLCLAAAGLAASLLLAATSRADDAKVPWQPKAPEGLPTDFDWIRLPSDEWLKGKILSMYDGKLEFDSDELGVHTFDFADIKEIRTSRVVQVGLADKPAGHGPAGPGRQGRAGRRRDGRDGLRPFGDPHDRGRRQAGDRLLVRLRQPGRHHPQRQQRPDRLHGAARDGASFGPGPHRDRLHRQHHPHRRRGHVQQPPGHARLGPLPDQAPVPQPDRPRVVPRPVPERRQPLDGHRGPRLRARRHCRVRPGA